MSSTSSLFYASGRPTLPPLHTLDLPVPFGRRGSSPVSYDMNDCPSSSTKNMYHSRRTSTFSSNSSRTPSPSLSEDASSASHIKLPTLPSHPSLLTQSPSTPSSRIRPTVHASKYRLIPCSLEEAEAVVVVPPPGVAQIPSIAASKKPAQALLLVGPALSHVRNPQRPIAKGARIHPYRFLRAGVKATATKPAAPST